MNKLSLLKLAYVLVGSPYADDPDDVAAKMPSALGEVLLGIPYAEERKARELAMSGKSNVTDDQILAEDQNRLLGALAGGLAGMAGGAKAGKSLVNNRIGRMLLGALGLTVGTPVGMALGARSVGAGHHVMYGPGPSDADIRKFDRIIDAAEV